MAKKPLYKNASPVFHDVYSQIEKVVKKTFPRAQTVFAHGMSGWKIRIPQKLQPKNFTGTFDPTCVLILPVERKTGISLHILNPLGYYSLEKHRVELTKAGFKVLRACLIFSRKSAYPIDALAKSFLRIKKSLEIL